MSRHENVGEERVGESADREQGGAVLRPRDRDEQPDAGDPPRAHPVGTGLGAAGGAGVGAAVGSMAGPAGAAVGATVGALAGGLAGKATAEAIAPGDEDSYWRDHYLSRPYADGTLSYDYYRTAYRYGWESRARFADRRWTEVERELEKGWREYRGNSRLSWGDARPAVRDAWQRIENRRLDERERSAG